MRESSSRGIYPDEDLCHGFDIEIIGEFDNTNVVVDDLTQPFQRTEECVLVHAGIGSSIGLCKLQEPGFWREQFRQIGNPSRILSDSWIRNFEFLFCG